jgi:hypothetical protein
MINDIQRRILAEAAKFGGSNISSAQIIANELNETNHQSFMNGGAGGVATFGFGKAQFEGKMRQLLMKMGFEKGINKMDINGNKMVLYFANSAKANDFVITFNGLVKRSSKGSPATLSTSFDKIKSPAGTNAVVTVDFSMMKTEDLENGSDVFVMLEALYENSIEEAKTKNTHVTSVPAGASEKEFAKARAANPYRVRLGKGKPAGAPADKVKEDIEESASKAALEDFMYALPKAAIEELRPVMKMKQGVGRMAKITAVLKKHGITQKLMGSYPAAVVNDYFDTFHGESVELESDGINESMNNYLAFYNGKKITVQAETSYKAQLKAIEMFKAPASKKHMVNVKLAGGGALANNESVEENEEKIDEQSVARRLGQTIGALRHGKPTPKDRLDDLTVERKRRDYQKKLKNDPVFQAQNAAAKKEEQDYIKAEIARLKTFLTKEEVESVEESLAQPDEKVIGIFYEKTQNNVFEYRMSTDPWGKSHGLPHEVCVGPRNFVSGAKVNWRAANVKATVCYIAVDELEDGKPDIDKWNIKKHFKYVKAN